MGQRHAPAALYPGKDTVPIVQEAGWAPGPVWAGAEKSRLPPEFDPRTVQPVASRYTDWATLPTNNHCASKFDNYWNICLTFRVLGLHLTPAHNEPKCKRILRLSLRYLQCTTFVVRSVILRRVTAAEIMHEQQIAGTNNLPKNAAVFSLLGCHAVLFGKYLPTFRRIVRWSAPLYRHWGSVQAVRPIGGLEV
jgi:hypothetical protein